MARKQACTTRSGMLGSSGAPQPIQIIRPRLHHLAAFGEVLGAVVGLARLVRLDVRELALDDVGSPAHLVEVGGSHRAEAVRR